MPCPFTVASAVGMEVFAAPWSSDSELVALSVSASLARSTWATGSLLQVQLSEDFPLQEQVKSP